MPKHLPKVSKEQDSAQINKYLQKVGKNNTVNEIVRCKDEPCISKIKRDCGIEKINELLAGSVAKISNITGTNLNQDQVVFLMEWIAEYYFNFTISDINQITKLMVQKKYFPKPQIQDITAAFMEYEEIRLEAYRLYLSEDEKSDKEIKDENNEIYQYYQKLKQEPKNKPIEDERKKNSERIKKLRAAIGTDEIPDGVENYKPKYL